jgi:hypothetical protein
MAPVIYYALFVPNLRAGPHEPPTKVYLVRQPPQTISEVLEMADTIINDMEEASSAARRRDSVHSPPSELTLSLEVSNAAMKCLAAPVCSI